MLKEIFKYNTKNCSQQLFTLIHGWEKHLDKVSKKDMIDSIRSIAFYLHDQYEEYKDVFEDK